MGNTIKPVILRLVVGAVTAGTAVGLASPASAEPLSGNYTATVTASTAGIPVGSTRTVDFTPCGTDCTHFQAGQGNAAADLHLQGDTWTGSRTAANGVVCNETLAPNLVLSEDCEGKSITFQLSKNA
jgi:hypothetical protein